MNKQKKHVNDRVIVYAVIWSLSYIGSLFALKTLDISQAAGIILTLVTILAFSLFIYKYYRSIYFMDEVQVKIQMEAVVIAFSLGLLLLMTLGLLELRIQLNKDDWSYRHLFPMFLAFYFIGLLISRNKYNFENEKHD
jgi:hypothetical protein